MALIMAIGEIQRKAGADARITAPAAIAKDDAPRWLTGVWKGTPPTSETPVPEKETAFLGYLASGPSALDAGSPPDLEKGVELLGKGSLGSDAEDEDIVRAPLVGISSDGSALSGRHAWVVLDEGTKAKSDLVREEDERQLRMVGTPPRQGIEAIAGLEEYNWIGGENLSRLITFPTSDLIGDMPSLGEFQHDLTLHHRGLLTDSSKGGMKKDLSLLMSLPALPQDYTGKRIYDDTKAATDLSNPLWQQLFDFGRLRSKLIAADGTQALQASVPTAYNPVKYDVRTRTYRVNPQAPAGALLTPVISKMQMQFSLVAKDAHAHWPGDIFAATGDAQRNYMVYMIYSPIITLYNPYDVPLQFEEMRIDFKDLPLGFRFFRNGQPQTVSLAHFNQLYVDYQTNSSAQKTFGINLKSTFSKSKSEPVLLQPGEARVFGESVSGSLSWNSGIDSIFDWQNNLTADIPLAPGYPSQGVGFWIDWLTPTHLLTPQDEKLGILSMRLSDTVDVEFAPLASAASGNRLSIEVSMVQAGRKYRTGALDLDYVSTDRLKAEWETKDEKFPLRLQRPYRGTEIYEKPSTPLKEFVRAKPFAIFSYQAKTTLDSSKPAMPWVTGGHSTSLSSIDLAKTDTMLQPFEASLKRLAPSYRFPIDAANRGRFFSGDTDLTGTRVAPQFEVPMVPLDSLAQLRHAGLSNQGFFPGAGYTVGESFASPMIPGLSVSAAGSGSYRLLDHTWLANTTFWDGWFLSTLANYDGPVMTPARTLKTVAQEFFTGDKKLLNPRVLPVATSGNPEAEVTAVTAADGYLHSAAKLMLDGAFNVNSVSVNAWKTMLSSLNGEELQIYHLTDGSLSAETQTVSEAVNPFSRTRRPTGPPLKDGDPRHARWTGMRSLSGDEVDELARNIVAEVKKRGPFLSLAEFVNRAPGTDPETSIAGALQSAIDATPSINKAFEADSRTYTPDELAITGVAFPEAMQRMNATGAPGYLTQGDLLSVMGSLATVRSDTFRIRAYGEALDTEGKVIARAWCEAVVQRTPDFLDPENAADALVANLNATNARFGRQLHVTGFRWLGKDEI